MLRVFTLLAITERRSPILRSRTNPSCSYVEERAVEQEAGWNRIWVLRAALYASRR